ncbi:pantothenate synthetase [Paraoerskovia sediminicola]|uniref:Pantothenate synthetase n=1 Tax=Paraoerskovia sediminicola TaxID=1138587 RepID=A0ABN6XGJ7_9CELL|nr:pantoate--beta-alanine ligase [Paraoerskovia sediminicola]BDZ42608.1 pantothenate synthetase [Paraoerskovia sediminicola]
MTTTPHNPRSAGGPSEQAARRGPTVVRTRALLASTLGRGDGLSDGRDGGRSDRGERPRRAVVMTMGALHDGHLRLVERAREAVGKAGQVVVTIFVNPLQFGPDEDLDAYPRDLERDVELLTAAGVDVVFAPDRDVVYRGGDPIVRVSAGTIGEVLEGAHRPGHFDGVLTVVLKLLRLVRPDVAVFGEKDAQQLLAVRRMVHDLDVPVEIVGVPIVREPDGLALSSRNVYLSADERAEAVALSAALRAGEAAAGEGRGPQEVVARAAGMLNAHPGVAVDYLALVDPTTVEDVGPAYSGPALLLVAARVGTTRLIDNLAVDLPAQAS